MRQTQEVDPPAKRRVEAPGPKSIELTEPRLDAVLDTLVHDGVLNTDQAGRVRGALRAESPPAHTRVWVEIAGYVGGVLMLGGGALGMATTWRGMTDTARAGVLSAVTVALFAAALVVAGGRAAWPVLRRSPGSVRRRIASVLLALAAAAAAGAAGVLAGAHAGLVASTVGLVVAAAGYALLRAVPGLLACAAASFALATAVANEISQDGPVREGVALVVLGAAWIVAGLVRKATPVAVAFGVGSVLALIGAQQLGGAEIGMAAGYLTLFGLSAVLLVLYRVTGSVVLLVVGVLAAAIAAPEAAWDLTNGAVGGASILLSAGAVLVAASVYGIRRHRGQAPPPPDGPAPPPDNQTPAPDGRAESLPR